jgi:hypothetical protein
MSEEQVKPEKQKKKRIRRTRAEIEAFEADCAEKAKAMLAKIERTVDKALEKPVDIPEVIELEQTEPIEPEAPKQKRVRIKAELHPPPIEEVAAKVAERVQEAPFVPRNLAKRVRPQDVLPTLEKILERRDPRYRLKFALAGAVFGAAALYSYAPNIMLASSNLI